MYRKEKSVNVSINPSIASVIKYGFVNYIRWPALSIGTVLVNTTTAINEEWLTMIESMPTRKVFHEYTDKILNKTAFMCVHIRKTQTELDKFITMADFDYYIVTDNEFFKIDIPTELSETLIHIFIEYRNKNSKSIELVAFSAGMVISDTVIHNMNFLDIEVFNREYANIKATHSEDRTYSPFTMIAPGGVLKLFYEEYKWINTKKHIRTVLKILEKKLVSAIKGNSILTTTELNFCNDVSQYDHTTNTVLVKDMITMCVINFFGCKSQLGTYHKFNMSVIDIPLFITEVISAIDMLIGAL